MVELEQKVENLYKEKPRQKRFRRKTRNALAAINSMRALQGSVKNVFKRDKDRDRSPTTKFPQAKRKARVQVDQAESGSSDGDVNDDGGRRPRSRDSSSGDSGFLDFDPQEVDWA